ncbi:hypothetical protein N7516_006792, partial [Penicillium verrucosum]|uniref:uncharacterized protein n=1 Tax=Penicillium verrucosum TaxID=60171 RepID=UPI0025456296
NNLVTNPDINTDTKTRSVGSPILYLLTPQRPLAAFHRNQRRTVYSVRLAKGRGWYVIVHADEVSREHRRGYSAEKPKARIEAFVVGPGFEIGERLLFCYRMHLREYIFEMGEMFHKVVVPGFEFAGHDFLRKEQMEEVLTAGQVRRLRWMLKELSSPSQESK